MIYCQNVGWVEKQYVELVICKTEDINLIVEKKGLERLFSILSYVVL